MSDFHKMIVTAFKTTFRKAKPKEVTYRSYKNYDKNTVGRALADRLDTVEDYVDFKANVLDILNKHAPKKKRLIRANEVPYMTKTLRKAIANRSRLENQFYKLKTETSKRAYRKQKNYCSKLYKKERRKFYENLDIEKITDNKKFWKTMKPFFSDKGAGKTDIILIEGEKIIQADSEIADVMNNFFKVI